MHRAYATLASDLGDDPEYDNTAIPSGDAVIAAPLLGRGWRHGITLSPGEVETVPVAMYAKGTIVTVCGAPASGGAGT